MGAERREEGKKRERERGKKGEGEGGSWRKSFHSTMKDIFISILSAHSTKTVTMTTVYFSACSMCYYDQRCTPGIFLYKGGFPSVH